MKDILVIREEKNADEAILGFIRSKYDSKIISFDSKQAENLLMTEGIRIIVVFMDNTAASSLVELRRMIMYFKNSILYHNLSFSFLSFCFIFQLY